VCIRAILAVLWPLLLRKTQGEADATAGGLGFSGNRSAVSGWGRGVGARDRGGLRLCWKKMKAWVFLLAEGQCVFAGEMGGLWKGFGREPRGREPWFFQREGRPTWFQRKKRWAARCWGFWFQRERGRPVVSMKWGEDRALVFFKGRPAARKERKIF